MIESSFATLRMCDNLLAIATRPSLAQSVTLLIVRSRSIASVGLSEHVLAMWRNPAQL
jgi:hypothetical protein